MKAAAFLMLIGAAVPAHAAVRFAIIIGNNVGEADELPLRWAELDAVRTHAVLTELGGVATGRAIVALGNNAEQVRNHLARLHGQVEEARRQGYRTELFLFFSGHGDANSLHLGPSRLPLRELHERLGAMPTDITVAIIDACRSRRSSSRVKGARPAPSFEINLVRDPGPRGQVIISSAAPNEIAQESDELGGSFFTHHLVSGLRGAADADSDGRVTLAEIYRYAYNRTLASSHGRTAAVQHPEMSVSLAGEGELVVTNLERAVSSLILPADLEGDLLIVDDRSGQVVAELHKSAGVTQTLALPAGRFRIQLRHQGRIYAGELPLEWGGRRRLDTSLLTRQPMVAAIEKGRYLDPAPWRLSIAAAGGTSTLFDATLAMGARAMLERTVRGDSWFARLTLAWTAANGENKLWHYRHDTLGLLVGGGYAGHLGPLQLTADMRLGFVTMIERGRRRDADRLQGVVDAPVRTFGMRAGPRVASELTVRVPIVESWSISTGAEVSGTWIRASGAWRFLPGVRLLVGVDRAF